MTKQGAIKKWYDKATLDNIWNDADFMRQFAAKNWTSHELVEFYHDVKELAWPEMYGDSPWGGTFSVAYAMVHGTKSDYYVNGYGKVYKEALALVRGL